MSDNDWYEWGRESDPKVSSELLQKSCSLHSNVIKVGIYDIQCIAYDRNHT